jgi:D-serine deaminase-like pyridoxal phosphate-dependent protein
VLDAGAKALTKDRMPWIDSYGHVVGLAEAVIDRLNDNHGMVTSSAEVAVGQRVVVVPNHICPVVNLFDEFVLAGDELIVSRIDLRGNLA